MVSQAQQLTARLDRLEDQLAVHETIAGYGLTVDGHMTQACGQLWTEDCWYDSDAPRAPEGGFHSRRAIESMIEGSGDVKIGFAHITHPPVVIIDGDVATAYAASHLPIAEDGQNFAVSRVSANKWDLRRIAGRWLIQRRTSRALDGSAEPKNIFAEAARAAEADHLKALRSMSEDAAPAESVSDADVAALEYRITAIEEKLAVLQVITEYAPGIDGGAVRESGLLWTEDCRYDSNAPAASDDGISGRSGIEQVAIMCGGAPYGIAHINHMPLIKVVGDRASVVNHSNTFRQEGGDFQLGRVSANRWDLVRTDGRWQVKRKLNRLLSGSPESREVLADGVRQVFNEVQAGEG